MGAQPAASTVQSMPVSESKLLEPSRKCELFVNCTTVDMLTSYKTAGQGTHQTLAPPIRMQVAKLQGIERGISRSSRKLTVDKADSLDGTARTVDSLHLLRREPSQKSVDPDATVIKIRDEVRRLQHLQQELAGGSKSSRTL
jgi:hypothetical protein